MTVPMAQASPPQPSSNPYYLRLDADPSVGSFIDLRSIRPAPGGWSVETLTLKPFVQGGTYPEKIYTQVSIRRLNVDCEWRTIEDASPMLDVANLGPALARPSAEFAASNTSPMSFVIDRVCLRIPLAESEHFPTVAAAIAATLARFYEAGVSPSVVTRTYERMDEGLGGVPGHEMQLVRLTERPRGGIARAAYLDRVIDRSNFNAVRLNVLLLLKPSTLHETIALKTYSVDCKTRSTSIVAERGWDRFGRRLATQDRSISVTLQRGSLLSNAVAQACSNAPFAGQAFNSIDDAVAATYAEWGVGDRLTGDSVTVASIITMPDWIRKPTSDDLQAFYPRDMEISGIAGTVVVRCILSYTGVFRDCAVATETPTDAGFGEAAMKFISRTRMRPEIRDGEPVDGTVVFIPAVFRPSF